MAAIRALGLAAIVLAVVGTSAASEASGRNAAADRSAALVIHERAAPAAASPGASGSEPGSDELRAKPSASPNPAAASAPLAAANPGVCVALRGCLPCPLLGDGAVPRVCGWCPPIGLHPMLKCPWPIPPPLPGRPAIFLCQSPAPEVRSGPVWFGVAICGFGFRSGEMVTITATGLHGSTSWTVHAAASGGFRSPLPVSVCHILPAQAAAVGSLGSHAPPIRLGFLSCAPRM